MLTFLFGKITDRLGRTRTLLLTMLTYALATAACALAPNLAVLALPVSGLWGLRLYESALIRQTESELVAQGVVWSAAFRQELRRDAPDAAAPRLF